jgi:hypothetical protein
MSVQYGGDKITFADGSTVGSGWSGFKNRIINGAMMIDQRNVGASVTPTDGLYTLDRWSGNVTAASKFTVQQNAGSVTPPAGFVNYLGATSSSAYSIGAGDAFTVYQAIEGLNVSDLAWGTASASPVTLSFWVRSSLTGTFGGSLRNSASNRSYPFAYTISAANTWEQKSITIAGDTSGTWLKTNGIGATLIFSLGTGATYSGTAGSWAGANYVSATGATSVVGTSGATFYITGVQLEKGSTATSFDYRPYGTELALCQRYYYRMTGGYYIATALNNATNTAAGTIHFPVEMRASPTSLEQSGTASNYAIAYSNTAANCTGVPLFVTAGKNAAAVQMSLGAVLTLGAASLLSNQTVGYLGWSAEL